MIFITLSTAILLIRDNHIVLVDDFNLFLTDDQGSSVHGYILDGIFDGVITTQQEEYHIEVAEKFFNQPGEFHSVIYAVSDVDFSAINGSQASCGGSGKAYEKLREIQSTAAKPTAKQLHSFRTKRALSPDNRFCLVYVAADQLFYDNVGRSDDTVTMSEIATRMTSVNGIFSGTDFDFDGGVDSIGFHIGRIGILRSSDPGYRYGAANIAVTDFLDLWSQENHDEFCLALLLTYRDFDGGVLGLAWVAEAPGGNRGGICETRLRLSVGQRNLNSAIVTFLNFGNTQPRPVTIITMAHEFGHNFGSPVSNCVVVCVCACVRACACVYLCMHACPVYLTYTYICTMTLHVIWGNCTVIATHHTCIMYCIQ